MDSAPRLAERALSSYDLDERAVRLLTHTENAVFRVEGATGERFVLRISRPARTLPRVRSELEWLSALGRDTDLVVPEPVRTRSGDRVGVLDGPDMPEPRCFVVFRWIAGESVEGRLGPALYGELGQLLAQLHAHARSFETGPGFDREIMTAEQFRPDQLPAGLSAWPRLSDGDRSQVVRAFARIHDELAGMDTGPDLFGLVHADLHHLNCLDVVGRLAPIDFDDCRFAPFGYDLAVPLVMTAERPDAGELQAALVAGYLEGDPEGGEVLRQLETMQAVRRIQLLSWLADSADNPELVAWADSFVPHSLAALQRYLDQGSPLR